MSSYLLLNPLSSPRNIADFRAFVELVAEEYQIGKYTKLTFTSLYIRGCIIVVPAPAIFYAFMQIFHDNNLHTWSESAFNCLPLVSERCAPWIMFPTNLEIFICTKNTTLTNTAAGPTSSSGMIRGFGKFKTQFCGHLIFWFWDFNCENYNYYMAYIKMVVGCKYPFMKLVLVS